jgi:hypothetical protein
MKNYILFSIPMILAVVLISGCTSGPVAQNAALGLAINSFESSDVQVDSGDPILLDIEVENVGGTTARNVQADLFGVEGQWKDSMGNFLTDTQTKDLGTLRPPLPERNIPGDFRMAQWTLMARDIPQGLNTPLQVEARVSYDYNTSGFLRVIALSLDEQRRLQINKQEPSFTAEAINSAGPLHLEVNEKFMKPIIVDTSASEDFIVQPFRFDFVDVGNGFPITPEDDARIRGAGGKLSGTIQVFGPGVEFDNCLGVTSGNIVNLDDSEITVKIRDTKRVPVGCSIRIDKSVWGSRPTDTIQFEFNIFYRYYVPAHVSISVLGSR